MRTLVDVTVTPVRDMLSLKRLRSRLSTVKSNLKKLESTQLKSAGFQWQTTVSKAKTFISLMSEKGNLEFKISDLLEETGAYKITLNCGKYILPQGFESFTISEVPHNAECFLTTATVGPSNILRNAIRTHRSPNRWIFIHCLHDDINFCIAIAVNGTYKVYQE
jgi:hypothetical protein